MIQLAHRARSQTQLWRGYVYSLHGYLGGGVMVLGAHFSWRDNNWMTMVVVVAGQTNYLTFP